MKIFDCNTVHQETIHSDVCIVGAGPAGVTLASKLADSGLDVIIVESGGKQFSKKVNELNTLRVQSNFIYRDKESRRNRQIGGTANLWVGRVVPFRFDPVLDSEWGDLKDVVLPFYDDAFRLFGMKPGFAGERANSDDELVAYWAHKTERFNAKSKIIKGYENVRIFQFLTCVGSPDFTGDRIKTLAFVNQKNERSVIQSRCFVFAMGAIENARMLLIMKNQIQGREDSFLKNAGKYVMDHPRVWHGTILNKSRSFLIDNYQLKSGNYGICKSGIRNQPGETRVYSNIMRSGNRATVWMDKISISSFQVSSKRLILRERGFLRMLANEMARLPIIRQSNFLENTLRGYFNRDSSSLYHLMTYCEQRPRYENQLILAEERDRNGLQSPALINNLHPDELSEVVNFFESLKKKISDLGGVLEYNPEHLSQSANYTDASHIMGGTRYSNQKEKAVVDKELNVMGIPNLFVTGRSVFPTSSVENPTHLIVSLSCYLAEVLKEKFK